MDIFGVVPITIVVKRVTFFFSTGIKPDAIVLGVVVAVDFDIPFVTTGTCSVPISVLVDAACAIVSVDAADPSLTRIAVDANETLKAVIVVVTRPFVIWIGRFETNRTGAQKRRHH